MQWFLMTQRDRQHHKDQAMDCLDKYVTSKEDIAFEYEILKDSKKEATWQRYFDHIKSSSEEGRFKLEKLCFCYERCLESIPKSYQIWLSYLDLLEETGNTGKYVSVCENALGNCALSYEIWVLYLGKLFQLKDIRRFDVAFDKCLKQLPLKSHLQLWSDTVLKYIKEMYFDIEDEDTSYEFTSEVNIQSQLRYFVSVLGPQERTLQRPTISDVDKWTSFYIQKYTNLISLRHDSESQMAQLYKVLCRTKDYEYLPLFLEKHIFTAKKPATMYFQYLVCVIYFGTEESQQRAEHLIAEAVTTYPNDRKYFILLHCHFTLIRKSKSLQEFNEFMNSVLDTITDVQTFNQIYEFYVAFQNMVVESFTGHASQEEQVEKLERMISNYDLLLNMIKIKKSPNRISLWIKRSELGAKDDINFKISVFNTALQKISSTAYELEGSRSITGRGKLGGLWTLYADLYFASKDYDSFRQVMHTATKVPFKYLEDLENIYLHWSLRELELQDPDQAIKVLQAGLNYPEKFGSFVESAELVLHKYYNTTEFIPVQVVATLKSYSLWDRLLQLHELYRSRKETDAIYECMIQIKIAKPCTFITYAELHYNDFVKWVSIYNKALKIFESSKSVATEIYGLYLDLLLERVQPSNKVYDRELVRDVFENLFQDLERHGVDCAGYYIRCADFEITLGNYQQSMACLYRGTQSKNVNLLKNKNRLWFKLLELATKFTSVVKVRQYFEEGLMSLPNSTLDNIVIQYAEFEINSGPNYARAREILRFGGECGPVLQHSQVWDYWKQFEIKYGNKDTFKDMLRTKRIVGDKFTVNTQEVSHVENNIQFVSSGVQGATAKEETHEIELDI